MFQVAAMWCQGKPVFKNTALPQSSPLLAPGVSLCKHDPALSITIYNYVGRI